MWHISFMGNKKNQEFKNDVLPKNSKKIALFKKIVALGYLIQQKYHNDIRNMLP